jgi:hypothetical protein
MEMKRLNGDEVLDYMPLMSGDPFFARKAIAFTLTPDPENIGWETVTYYTNDSINQSPLSPLEIMYQEWDDINKEKDPGH